MPKRKPPAPYRTHLVAFQLREFSAIVNRLENTQDVGTGRLPPLLITRMRVQLDEMHRLEQALERQCREQKLPGV